MSQILKNKIWTTAAVKDTIKRRNRGEIVDQSCFWSQDSAFRAADIHFKMTQYELDEFVKCSEDVIYFVKKYCKIMTDEGITNIPELYPYQPRLLDTFMQEQFSILMACRQSGKTVTIGMFLAWYICFHYERNVLILANKQDTTIEIIDKIKNIIKNLPFFLQPGVKSGGKTGLHFDNDTRIFSQSTTSTAAIGFTIHLLFADEFAHIKPNFINEFYRSVYPTISSSKIAKMIICSTPNKLNLFYRLYDGAEKGRNSFKPLKVDWWEVPGRDAEWRQREIANMGSEEAFEQEFGNKFIVSSSMLLDKNTISFTNKIVKEYIWKELDFISLDDDEYEELKWYPTFDPTEIYDNDKFVITIDLADGVGKDFSVINIFKIEPLSKAKIKKLDIKDLSEKDFFRLRQVGRFSSNEHSVPEVAKLLEVIIFEIFAPEILSIVMEMNFKGSTVIDHLQHNEDFYPEMFIHTKHRADSKSKKLGVLMRTENKQELCRNFKNRAKNRQIITTEPDTLDQLQSFTVNEKGRYDSASKNDDLAISNILTEAYFNSINFNDDVEFLMQELPSNLKLFINKYIYDIETKETKDDIEVFKELNDMM